MLFCAMLLTVLLSYNLATCCVWSPGLFVLRECAWWNNGRTEKDCLPLGLMENMKVATLLNVFYCFQVQPNNAGVVFLREGLRKKNIT